jgi:hypothetical protein
MRTLELTKGLSYFTPGMERRAEKGKPIEVENGLAEVLMATGRFTDRTQTTEATQTTETTQTTEAVTNEKKGKKASAKDAQPTPDTTESGE